MGQKQVKKYRKIAEKVSRTQAFFLAQNQILEIMKAPFRYRLKFAFKILFPPKDRIKIPKSNNEIIAAAHGIDASQEAIKQVENKEVI